MSVMTDNYNLKDYYKNVIKDDLLKYKTLIEWTEDEKEEFKQLLCNLKKPFDNRVETTKDKGDRLENLVSFIIEKSYFFKVYRNVHTETNEIDEVIVFTDEGKQAISRLGFSRDLVPIESDIFLGECKNYKSSLGVTYVGKFYSLLTATSNSFGIIFTQNGLTGDSAGYKDAYGLTKVIRMIEANKNQKDFYIITFTLEDYEELLKGHTFFELVDAKKKELQMAADYHTFLNDNKHENEEAIKKIIGGLANSKDLY